MGQYKEINKTNEMQKFLDALQEQGNRLENCGSDYAKELQRLYTLLEKNIFSLQLQDVAKKITALCHATYFAMDGKATYEEVCQKGTELTLALEKAIKEWS